MPPRTILYTGKGGVGKTSVAAATARRCAAAGQRTLAISTDPAHSLAAALGVEVGSEPEPAGPHLWAQQVSANAEMARHWAGVREWLGRMLVERGFDRISAEELTVVPGMDEVFSLLRLRDAHDSGDWDVIVVDCAPTGETLRMLSFPDVARWWIDQVFPMERQILAAARPLARALLDIQLPTQAVFTDMQRLSENLISLGEILRDHSHCTVRLVMNPDKMVIGEAMRTFTYLNLYGYLTDAVVVNRVFPSDVGEYFAGWRQVQEKHLELVRTAFTPVPILLARYFDQEVTGSEMLDRLSEALFGDEDASRVMHTELSQEMVVTDSEARLRLRLPLATKGEISVKRIGRELVVVVAGDRRTITLPDSLSEAAPAGASFEDGTLEVRFALAGAVPA